MSDIQEIADKADMIVNGYAFTVETQLVRVLNLHNREHASVFNLDGELLETSMDDIELAIVGDYLTRNMKYLVA